MPVPSRREPIAADRPWRPVHAPPARSGVKCGTACRSGEKEVTTPGSTGPGSVDTRAPEPECPRREPALPAAGALDGSCAGARDAYSPSRSIKHDDRGRPAMGAARVQVHGRHLRGRCRHGNRPVVRFGLLWPRLARPLRPSRFNILFTVGAMAILCWTDGATSTEASGEGSRSGCWR